MWNKQQNQKITSNNKSTIQAMISNELNQQMKELNTQLNMSYLLMWCNMKYITLPS
jgi:uncharacterized FlaG/YvyC family protein